MKKLYILFFITLLISIISLFLQWQTNQKLLKAYCAIANGFTAERKSYVTLPDAEKNINPFFSAEFISHCD